MSSPASRLALPALLAAALLAAPRGAAGQQSADFLFKRPVVSITLRGGWSVPRTGSQIFDDITQRLTLDRRDFNALSFGGELAWRASERLDVTLGVDHARSRTASEFRNFVEDNDLPITQTTTFQQTPVALSVKGYLFQRGRSVSRFAWIPTASWSPYVGAGAGVLVYDFVQEGDFVDFQTLDIFTDRYASQGSAPMVQVLGGATFNLGRRVSLQAEGRYAWAHADLGRDFRDFEPIGLGGFMGTLGLSARF